MEGDKSHREKRKHPRAGLLAKITLCFGIATLVLSGARVFAFYLYASSGGLNRVAANLWPVLFAIYPLSLIAALILAIASFVNVFIREQRRQKLILTSVALILIICSWQVDWYATFGLSFDKAATDEDRYFAHTEITLKAVKWSRHGIGEYVEKDDGQLPSASSWYDVLVNSVPEGRDAYSTRRGLQHFAMNSNVGRFRLTDIANDIVLLFETEPGKNRVTTGDDITARHYGKGCLVLFADLDVEFVKAEDLEDLRWKP